jgi:hypothetical protein
VLIENEDISLDADASEGRLVQVLDGEVEDGKVSNIPVHARPGEYLPLQFFPTFH